MNARTNFPTLEHLLSHRAWLRSLAATLVTHGDEADDVVQETFLQALERPPHHDANLRGWLASTCRRLAGRRKRSDRRRLERERERAEVHGSAPGTDALVERLEIESALVNALANLREPHRTVLLLRYFEGLEPRAIARRLERPIATVKSQLHRGLSALRAELERTLGKGDGWRERLLFLVRANPALGFAAPFTGGLLAMKTSIVFATALVTLLVSAWFARDAFDTSSGLTSGDRALENERPGAEESRSPSVETRITRAEHEPGDAREDLPVGELDRDLFVQVLDASGTPRVDVPIVLSVQTGIEGMGITETFHRHFTAGREKDLIRIPRSELRKALEQLDDVRNELITFRRVAVRPDVGLRVEIAPWTTVKDVVPDHPIRFRLPSSARLQVTVLDDRGQPLDDADLVVSLGLSRGSRDENGHLDFRSPEVVSERVEDGRVTFHGVPLERAYRVRVEDSRHRYRSVERRFEPFTFDGETRRTELVLDETHPILVGRLIDEERRPIAGATVDVWARNESTSFGYAIVETDERGSFEVVAAEEGSGDRYTFLEFVQRADPKRAPRRGTDEAERLPTGRIWHRSLPRTGRVDIGDIVLRVPRRAKEPKSLLVGGVVQDPAGQPLEHAVVRAYGSDTRSANPVTAGTEDASSWSWIRSARTDAQGRFRIEANGLPERLLLNASGEDRVAVRMDDVEPGSKDVLITLPRGAVLTGSLRLDEELDPSTFVVTLHPVGRSVVEATVEKDGSFALTGVPPRTAGEIQVRSRQGVAILHREPLNLGLEGASTTELPPIDLRGRIRTYRLRITDTRDHPLGNTRLRALPDEDVPCPAIQTDLDGRMKILTPVDRETVIVACPGYRPCEVTWSPLERSVPLHVGHPVRVDLGDLSFLTPDLTLRVTFHPLREDPLAPLLEECFRNRVLEHPDDPILRRIPSPGRYRLMLFLGARDGGSSHALHPAGGHVVEILDVEREQRIRVELDEERVRAVLDALGL